MKIGLFSETFLPVMDGVGRTVQAYAYALCAMGHEVTVSAPMYEAGYRGGWPFQLVDWKSRPVPGARHYRMGMGILDGNYQKRMKEIKLDIVHAHTPFSAGLAAWYAARRRDAPLVYTFHSKYYDDFYKATRSRTLSRAGIAYLVRFMRCCDEVWAVSEPAARVVREYGFSGPVRVMPNGVEIRSPNAQASSAAALRFGLGDAPALLFAGQMDWKKNILLILMAAALLRRRGLIFRLILAGQGKDMEGIRRKTRELGLEEITVFTGHLTDTAELDALYQRADLFLFPSLYDTAGLVVREAAAMGTPSVLIRGSDAADVIVDGGNGFLCENDPESLARILAETLSDKERLAHVGRNARETLPKGWDEIVKDVVRQYERIIETHRARRRMR